MKRLIVSIIVLYIAAVVLTGCGESEYPLDAEKDNERSVVPVAEPGDGSIVVNLSAGTDFDIGTVTCRLDGDVLHFDYAAGDDWFLVATHLDVERTLEDIPSAWAGMPNLFLFPFKEWHIPFVTEYSVVADLEASGLGDATEVYVAAHAFAVKFSDHGWIEHIASAWGEGERFPKPSPGVEPGTIRWEMLGALVGCGEGERFARIIPEDQRAFMETQGSGLEELFRVGRPMYFVLDIRRLRGLLLWNKLGSAAEIENSEVGPDGIIVGDIEYLPGRYGNGFKPRPRTGDLNIPDNHIDFPDLNLGPQGCIEFWYHPDWIDYRIGHIVGIFAYGLPSQHPVSNYDIMLAGFNNWQNLFDYYAFDGPGDGANTVGLKFCPSSTPGWTTSEAFHMGFTWDGTAPNPQDRLTCFINGNQVGSHRFGGDPTFSNWPADAILRLGIRLMSGDWNRHHWEGCTGIIDNIKVWGYPKTDFSDRFEE